MYLGNLSKIFAAGENGERFFEGGMRLARCAREGNMLEGVNIYLEILGVKRMGVRKCIVYFLDLR